MSALKDFRKVNGLTQTDVGDYLGIKKSFISRIEVGAAKLPEDKFNKLLNNPNGWDTSALTRDVQHVAGNMTANANGMYGTANVYNGDGHTVLSASTEATKVAVLEEKVKYLEMLIEEKNRLIDVLMKKN